MADLGLLQTLVISFIFTLDAFFVSIAYGMSHMSVKKMITLSSLVSLFCMLSIVFGSFIGGVLLKNNYLYTLIGTLLFGFGFNMIFKKQEDDMFKNISYFSIFLFSLSLSVDSFSISIALCTQYTIALYNILIFGLVSFIMTGSGLLCGRILSKKTSAPSNILQGLAMCVISYRMLLKLK